jgi:acetyl esterase
MALEPQTRKILDLIHERQGDFVMGATDVATARRVSDARPMPPGPDCAVDEREIPGPGGSLAVRRYRPHDAEGALGALVYFHGGGFVLGGLDGHDGVCRQIAVESGACVLSVDYRLAPEAKFPAAPEDCFAATRWAYEQAGALGIDPERIAVGGDSAGANLAAVTALQAREVGGPPLAFQLLVYPVTDWRTMDSPSYRSNADGYFLTHLACLWFREHYARDEADWSDPRLSPLVAKDLSGLPPALVITAEHDPLLDDGERYADALRAAGTPVTQTRYDGTIHGFFSLYPFLDVGRRAVSQACEALRSALA